MAISQLASHGDDPSDDSNDIQRPSQECSNTDLNGAAWVSQLDIIIFLVDEMHLKYINDILTFANEIR